MFKNYRYIKQKVAGKKYKLFIAASHAQKKKGLSGIKKLPARTGMLFPYDSEQKNRTFTMKNVNFNLRIIFFDKKMNIIYQEIGRSNQIKSIICEKPSMYVIEIPA